MHGWRAQSPKTYTGELKLAGRFVEHLAMQYVKAANEVIGDTDYPIEVMVEVNNTFLPREAQRILAEYEATGDRSVIDHAYFAAKDRALAQSPEFLESWGQMLRGEGREIDPAEFGGH